MGAKLNARVIANGERSTTVEVETDKAYLKVMELDGICRPPMNLRAVGTTGVVEYRTGASYGLWFFSKDGG